MKRTYKFIFLDLDDTIWDFHTNAQKALYTIFHTENLNVHYESFEQFYQVYSKKNLELWSQYGQGVITKDILAVQRFLYPLQVIGIHDEEKAGRMNTSFLDTLGDQTELMPYAKEFMDFCVALGLPMTIVSNGFCEVQYKKLRNSRIEDYFAHVVLSEEAGALKPDPAIFEYALNLNNARHDEVLMIGDSFDADIMGASRANIDALFLNTTRKQVHLPNGTLEIISLKEALDYLKTRVG